MASGAALVKCCQQVEGSEPFPLLSPGKAAPGGVLCPVLCSTVQERQGHVGDSPKNGHKDDEGSGALLQSETVDRRLCSAWRGQGSGQILPMLGNT